MFFGIVVLGLPHGLCIMPVYLSIMCWSPAVIRPRSVSDSAEKVNDGLDLESIESEEEVGANDYTALPLSIQNDAVAIDDKKDVGENKQDNPVITEPDLNEDKLNREG